MKLNKKHKKIIIAISVVFSVLVVLYFVLGATLDYLVDNRKKDDSFVSKDTEISYYTPQSTEVVTEDAEYIAKDRALYYTEFGETFMFESLESDMPECAELFYNYFETLINGDVKKHFTLFTDDFFDMVEMPKSFSAQRVYEIRVTLDQRDFDEKNQVFKDYFKVEYKIMKNDGSYRADLPSDTNIPIEFEVLRFANGAKINNIFTIKFGTG